MKPSLPLARLLLGGALALASAALASASGLDELAQSSPFQAREGNAAGVATTATGSTGELEFRGVIASADGVMLGLFDRAANRSFWVPAPTPGQTQPSAAPGEISVREYDPKASRVWVDYHGRTFTLVLADAKIGISPPVEVPAASATDSPTNSADNVPAPAEEVQRRRSLRQVEVVNEALRAMGATDLLLPGNPTTPSAPTAAPVGN